MHRAEIINTIIQQRGYKSYLELGVLLGETFSKIQCPRKMSVDQNTEFPVDFAGSTDEFFVANPIENTFDIIFIDANHSETFVWRDIHNSLKILNPGGMIICHDCDPPTEWHQATPDFMFGTSWKALARFRIASKFRVYCLNHDCGMGIIDTSQSTSGDQMVIDGLDYLNLMWNDFKQHRQQLLGLSDEIQ